jgi:hypothetical protein
MVQRDRDAVNEDDPAIIIVRCIHVESHRGDLRKGLLNQVSRCQTVGPNSVVHNFRRVESGQGRPGDRVGALEDEYTSDITVYQAIGSFIGASGVFARQTTDNQKKNNQEGL